jgi:hypothetical protein
MTTSSDTELIRRLEHALTLLECATSGGPPDLIPRPSTLLAEARARLAQPESEVRPIWTEGVCGDGAAILKDGVMQPIESVIAALNAAELAQPEPEGAPDAEALMAAWDSAISKPRVGRLAEYRTWLAYALSLVWAVNRVQTQPETEGPTDEQWDAIKERLWDKYETVGYLGERFMYQGDFDTALDVARQDLAPAQPELEGGQVRGIFNCRWDGPPPSPHASVSDWFEQEGSKGILYGLRISALPSRNEVPRAANFWLEGMQP